ncbi:mitogen-activated protein kinase kinase kinase NPK1-like [Salvia splendens]|uniref:mitogen-activated protein kinase kinase kinase NPK1-like n=1 Tax=Salvia splendens TaxID=180675 RepID=UPI001C25209A|nr:mitogen-activated protein kinase kinase kinase NPK1-like [Salvia splendens]
MQDFIGSVRRSLVFKPSGEESAGFGGIVEKLGSSIRKSGIGIFAKPPVPALPSIARRNARAEPSVEEEQLPPMEGSTEDEPPVTRGRDNRMLTPKSKKEEESKKRKEVGVPPLIRWRKGELIGCGAFGRVHMGMNLDSGELLAVKEVSIAANSASKKTQEYIGELEKEVNLLKNLSHPNIVRYLGTAREDGSLNILLEFVPGGSISSLLGKFGSFPESVIRMYTKQLLLGLEYLHNNKIMHRDIKGANILVDNKGCIKLADFGASKKVEALATITGAKSMKGTPYWMAPEVIVQSGHSYSADIWSVGCTVIEMATGKAPWSQQYQEVAALFHVGTTKSHPPIPDHLSPEANDFLLKCLQKEPELRATASELLKHPFVTGEGQDSYVALRSSHLERTGKRTAAYGAEIKKSMNLEARRSCNGLKDIGDLGGASCSTVNFKQYSEGSLRQPVNFDDDDMCRIDDNDDLVFGTSTKFRHSLLPSDCNQSFNPMCEPNDDWGCKFDENPDLTKSGMEILPSQIESGNRSLGSVEVDCGFTFPRQSESEDDNILTEAKIKAFLDEKAVELNKLKTPLFAFYNSLNVAGPPSPVGGIGNKENVSSICNLPPKSRSPNKMASRRFSTALDADYCLSPRSFSRRASNIGGENFRTSQGAKELPYDYQPEPLTPNSRFGDIQRKWKEELVEELERTRELMRQAGTSKTSSPKDRIMNRQKDRLKYASPGK